MALAQPALRRRTATPDASSVAARRPTPVVERVFTAGLRTARKALGLVGALLVALPLIAPPLRAAEAVSAAEEKKTDDELDDVTVLPLLEVKGTRVEEFGFRFNVTVQIPGRDTVSITEVWPNSAAAKAGLEPGDLVLKLDGRTPSALSLAIRPNKLQARKWAELAAGKKEATLVLQVRRRNETTPRTLTLVIPSPAPRWGGLPWTPPAGRAPAVVPEPGPLAALAREVLDQGIWSQGVTTAPDGRQRPALGYEWRIIHGGVTHRIWVTREHGTTRILFVHRSATHGQCGIWTSPAGEFDHGNGRTPKRKNEKRRPLTDAELRTLFAAELDFWLHRVGRVTGRWPFEVLPGMTEPAPTPDGAVGALAAAPTPLTESFRRLTPATPEQKALFLEALDKFGTETEEWACTETSRGLDGKASTTVRVDPSRPPAERITLLRVNGKEPSAAQRRTWSEGEEPLPSPADLPPLSQLVDTADVRVVAVEGAAIVFEVPVNAANAEFPAEKFQARFRVNTMHRGFEDFTVKLREAVRMAGVAQLTDVGIEARFRVVDPAGAPQLVRLKMGGGLRVLFVKFSRAFELTRTDFLRVTPHGEPPASPAP